MKLMEVGRRGQCGQTAAQILVGLGITEEIEYVIIQLQDGEERHALAHLYRKTNAVSPVQVIIDVEIDQSTQYGIKKPFVFSV